MKHISTLIIAAFLCTSCFAQTDSTGLEPNTDSTKKRANLTIGATYSNNASYYGQRAEEKMPYAAVSASYRLPFGLYFTGMSYKLLRDSGSLVSQASLGAGLSFDLGKNLSADINYSHTFRPTKSSFLQAANADMASASITFDKWVTTSVIVDYTFGKTNDLFVTAGIAKFINLVTLSEKDYISITPSVDVVGGSQRFYKTYITEKRLQDSILGLPLPPIIGSSQGSSTETKSTTTSSLDILSYNFKLPLAYNRSRYMIEAAYQGSMLGKNVESKPGEINSFLSFSFYYQF